jgi:hypothetical protein
VVHRYFFFFAIFIDRDDGFVIVRISFHHHSPYLITISLANSRVLILIDQVLTCGNNLFLFSVSISPVIFCYNVQTK